MLWHIMESEEPGLIGNFTLDGIAELMKGLEIAEHLNELGACGILRLIPTTHHHLILTSSSIVLYAVQPECIRLLPGQCRIDELYARKSID